MNELLVKMAWVTQQVSKPVLDPEWLHTSAKLFQLFDSNMDQQKGLGCVSYDKLQFFLLALLLKEITAQQNMAEVISRQT